ncbi:ferrochelatase-2, chloroplastic-like protein, partial [Tanacetum coccineum]
APKSKEGYASIGGGSPLRKITNEQEVPANVYVAMRYWYPFTKEAVQQMLLQVLFADHINFDLLWDEMPSASNKAAFFTVRSTICRLREQTELDLMVSLSIVIVKPL